MCLASRSADKNTDLPRPIESLAAAYDEFRIKELDSWKRAGMDPKPRDTLVRASGSLESPLAHHLLQPSYTTMLHQDGAETADHSNGCIAMVMANICNPETLLFDHLHRRSQDSKGLETLPPPVLECHEDHTRDTIIYPSPCPPKSRCFMA